MNATLGAPSRAQTTQLPETKPSPVASRRPTIILRASTAFLLMGALQTVAVLIAYFAAPV